MITYDELVGLLGSPLKDSEVFEKLSAHNCEHDSYHGRIYHSYQQLGICLLEFLPTVSQPGYIASVSIYSAVHKYRQYAGVLPHGLNWGQSYTEIQKLLGEPFRSSCTKLIPGNQH